MPISAVIILQCFCYRGSPLVLVVEPVLGSGNRDTIVLTSLSAILAFAYLMGIKSPSKKL
jgi:hypothetical protein